MELLEDFRQSEITVNDPYFVNALAKELIYLKKFEEDRLVAGFRETKGLAPKALKYNGWEVTEIRGHSMGHYLTAISQAYAQTGDEAILAKLDYIVDELAVCQLESGYLSAFEEVLFDNVENKKPCWVPWYTMDKIISGLTACYRLAGNKKALDIVSKLGVWVYNRVSKWSEETQLTVLAVEYGGMNEAMYELYMITGDERHEIAAHAFDEIALFTPIYEEKDILNGKHANTTIPKFLGGLMRYIARGYKKDDEFYLKSAEAFWDIVINHHTYVTGGNSEWEHFGEPYILDAERTNCNCETCNTYNMLKLSRELFKITKDKKYSDFYENTFMNAIMSSQNPETGMTMYFQPMATGYFKVYSTEFESFWCCTGTGMENFTKLNDSLYFHSEDTLYVNQFISSKVNWEDRDFAMEQISDIPNSDTTRFIMKMESDVEVAIRIPDWAAGEATFLLNGNKISYEINDGYVFFTEDWSEGDVIEAHFPMQVVASRLPDNKNVIALKYGPVVLSAGLGTEDMEESKTGVDVTIATRNISIKDFITIPEGLVEDWINNITKNVLKKEGVLEFSLLGTDSSELVFTPHYRQHTQRYGIYWNMVSKDSDALSKHILEGKEKNRRQRVAIDSIPLGNDQYELLHNIQGNDTGAATFNGLMLRHAWGENGWFSYEMKVDSKIKNYLLAKYFSPNAGRTFNIYINDKLLLEETIEDLVHEDFYDKYYEIPTDMIAGSDTITVKFVTRGDSFVGGMFDKLLIVKDYNDNAGIKDITFTGATLTTEFSTDMYEYKVIADGDEFTFKAELLDENGLLYFNDILIDDSNTRDVLLDKNNNVFKLRAYAENHKEFKEYCFKLERR